MLVKKPGCNLESRRRSRRMDAFKHHIYEYKKGVRDLFLHTLPKERVGDCEACLTKSGIAYLVHEISPRRVNLYFGHRKCIDIVQSFGDKPLNQYTNEEDFMLGIMLGYSRDQQYDRYRCRKLAASDAA